MSEPETTPNSPPTPIPSGGAAADTSGTTDTTTADGVEQKIVPTVDVGSRAFLVKVDLPSELVGLRPGMFARVSFRVGRKTPLVVPASAITRSGALDRLFVAEGDRLRLRMVTLGETQGDCTEVLSGVAIGERVVASPSPGIADGGRFTEQP